MLTPGDGRVIIPMDMMNKIAEIKPKPDVKAFSVFASGFADHAFTS